MLSLSHRLRLVVSFLLLIFCRGQECSSDGGLCDTHERCPVWKDEGECQKSKAYMTKYCPVSCGFSPPQTRDYKEMEPKTESFGVRQEAVGNNAASTAKVIQESIAYMESKDAIGHEAKCRNEHPHCSFWAGIGMFFFSCSAMLFDNLLLFVVLIFAIHIPKIKMQVNATVIRLGCNRIVVQLAKIATFQHCREV